MGEIAYCLALLPNMASIQNVYNVFMLGKYVASPSHILCHEILDTEPKAKYEEKPLRILDQKDRR